MTVRKAVPFTPEEIAEIEDARRGVALYELAGADAGRSEAAALRALVRLGLERVHEQAALAGYAALAASQAEEDRAYQEAVRGRRRGGPE